MKLRSIIASLAFSAAALAGWAQPKYVFFFIGDGMGMGPAMAAEMYNRQVLGNDQPITMMQFPVAGMCMTYSASSPVTDSAAAGTALSSGVKTRNGMLGMSPDTVAVYSVARALHNDGYGVGIITSVAPDDATPGAFYAHVPKRSMFYQIGVQAAESDYEFLAGADLRGLTDSDGNPTDLLQVLDQNGVQVVRGRNGLNELRSDRVILLSEDNLSSNNIGYTIDSVASHLTLPMLTQAGLEHLTRVSPQAFFMMVEGGNIDHALHANDGGAAIKEILNFNEALDIAYDFYLDHPDETLIVVTADHDTGGMSIGNQYLGYDARLKYIDSQRISKEAFEKHCRALLRSRIAYTWDDMREFLQSTFGFWDTVPVTEAQTESLKQKYDNTFELRNSDDQETLYANFNAFSVEVFKIFNDLAGIGFVGSKHTGNPVPVFAVGVGAENFSSLNNNIDIPSMILQITSGM